MATSNFYNKNASKIFASEIENEFDYDDLIDNVSYDIQDKHNSYYVTNKKYIDNGRYLKYSLVESVSYKDDTLIEVFINPIIRSGYYSGANLDYEYEYYFEGEEVYDPADIQDYLEYRLGYSEKKATKISDSRFKRLERIKNKLSKQLENIYESHTTPLVVTARFSNGETIYSKA
jgi:hypothetical protein